jgi:hypothetical protein
MKTESALLTAERAEGAENRVYVLLKDKKRVVLGALGG